MSGDEEDLPAGSVVASDIPWNRAKEFKKASKEIEDTKGYVELKNTCL